ncbi:MAG: twin-arginine translocase subunit TatC [Candidatus Acetothermia bacterium]
MRDEERPLGEHLEELRRRIINSLAVIVLFGGIAYFFRFRLLKFLIRASGDQNLIYLHPTEAFLTYLKLAVITGLILATPWILYQAWRFILPALMENEEAPFRVSFVLGGAFFYLGVGVALGLALPFTVRLLSSVGGANVVSTFSIRNYVTFTSLLSFALGIAFELPLLMVLIVRIGLVKPSTLRRNRKYAIVVSFIVAAFITPTDLFSQAFMAIPLIILYEISLLAVSTFFQETSSKEQSP